ncbi:endo-alpha-N-acetylgalactosaminidase family protein [Spirillospora sp. CA-294931]|uniref:endo-alpha-N-acetylgalactosaminidase family protein n=1 Tax=Spirillospora sp. CA-294931 TaxID=3240042 RepID=UPI003D8DF9D3
MKRFTTLTAVGAITAGLATALPAGAALAAPAGEAVLSSGALDVRVDRAFPRVISYTDTASRAVMYGQESALTSVVIDGRARTPKVASTVDGATASYVLDFGGGAAIRATIRVRGMVTEFRVTRVSGMAVGTLEIPGHGLVSVRSTQADATVRSATLSLDKAKEGDTVTAVTAATKPEAAPTGATYVVASAGGLAAALENNSVYDQPAKDVTDWDRGRFQRQARAGDGFTEVEIGNGQWTVRGKGAAHDEPLPYARVVISRDRNGDGRVDWQDGAIAMRDIMVRPLGGQEQSLRVVPHIPFNFASQATNPFLKTLDNVKRISLATDGLGQYTLLKGYASEGHDSAHPDYGGNYNLRAGGLRDMNHLLREGRKWNSDFAVHINATESYPEANAFSETLVDKNNKQWDWLNQSYMIDHRRDLTSGDIARRLADLRREADPALNMLYIDVFRESGWNSDALQRILRAQGWQVTTEWAHGLERSALWSHWANDKDYGPDRMRGINSTLIRFVRNHEKDVWADRDALLGTPTIHDFEGWVGKTDWNKFYAGVWTDNLPAKYLQAHPIKSWSDKEITFFGPTRVTSAAGRKQIFDGDRLVYDGGAYLLPWSPKSATKAYHYNPKGGTTTWKSPWRTSSVWVYKLTDQGRDAGTRVPVTGGEVTLDAAPGQPYAVYPKKAPPAADPEWGQFTPVKDPGFDSGTLKSWALGGSASVERNATGDYEAVVRSGSLSQDLRLAPGTYAASADVEVGATAGERRPARISVTSGGRTETTTAEVSTAQNHVAADVKHGSRLQRVFTYFTVDSSGRARLALDAGAGTARVKFDNVRVVAATRPGKVEGFEHVPQGWGPFVKGDAGGAIDPRTHLARRNAPYTQRGWNGKLVDDVISGDWSLKSRAENKGVVYRTTPDRVRFKPGHRYRVEFKYENAHAGHYTWRTAVDEPAARVLKDTPIGVVTSPGAFTQEFTAPAKGDAWVGLVKTGGEEADAEFVLDDFTVTDLGPAT